jgi:hypothetical protein
VERVLTARGAATRQRIVEAAAALIRERGRGGHRPGRYRGGHRDQQEPAVPLLPRGEDRPAAKDSGEIDASTDVDATATAVLAAIQGGVLISKATPPPHRSRSGSRCTAWSTSRASAVSAKIEHLYGVWVAIATQTPYTFAKRSCAASLGRQLHARPPDLSHLIYLCPCS